MKLDELLRLNGLNEEKRVNSKRATVCEFDKLGGCFVTRRGLARLFQWLSSSTGLLMVFNTTAAEIIDRSLPVSTHSALFKQIAYDLSAFAEAFWFTGGAMRI